MVSRRACARLPRHRRLLGTALAAMACCPLLAGCGGGTRPAASVLPPHAATVVGRPVTTAHGNTVEVSRYVDRVPGTRSASDHVTAAVKVRVCAGRHEPASIQPSAFLLLFHDGALPPTGGQLPHRHLLPAEALQPGACSQGWLAFVRPALNRPIGVVLSSSTVVLWRLTAT